MSGEAGYPAARAITRGPGHHFFGYYDKCPWDPTGRYVLGLETAFMDRPPTADDRATVGLIDRADGDRWRPLAETRAWNWQQGAMLQWLPSADGARRIIYNDREGDRFVAVIRDLDSDEARTLPRPIYAVSRDGRSAVCPSFARLQQTRPGYGYAGVPDPWADDPAPADDGIWWTDLASGESRLIVSLERIARFDPQPGMAGAKHWFNHLEFGPDDRRFIFLHRWRRPGERGWRTRLFTANPDGTDLHCVADHEMVSHFAWRDPRRILAWARQRDRGDHYYLFTDRTGEREIVGEGVLTVDGHCSYSPDGRWLLTDTYPDAERRRTLILYRLADGKRIDIGRFFAPPELEGEIRCDLHPRWDRDGTQICLDSAHQGARRMYVLDVGAIVAG